MCNTILESNSSVSDDFPVSVKLALLRFLFLDYFKIFQHLLNNFHLSLIFWRDMGYVFALCYRKLTLEP